MAAGHLPDHNGGILIRDQGMPRLEHNINPVQAGFPLAVWSLVHTSSSPPPLLFPPRLAQWAGGGGRGAGPGACVGLLDVVLIRGWPGLVRPGDLHELLVDAVCR